MFRQLSAALWEGDTISSDNVDTNHIPDIAFRIAHGLR